MVCASRFLAGAGYLAAKNVTTLLYHGYPCMHIVDVIVGYLLFNSIYSVYTKLK